MSYSVTGQSQKNPSSNVTFITLTVGCICILLIYQFSFGTRISLNSRSINQLIYESISASSSIDSNIIINVNSTLPTELNHSSNMTINNNNTILTNNNISSPLLFPENQLWLFQEKLTNYSKIIAQHSEVTNKTKRILGWNKDFNGGISPFNPSVGPDWFRKLGCPVWQCEVSGRGRGRDNNSNLALPIEEYDAVLFHDPTWFNMSLPAKRSPHQLYVWFNWEPPAFHSYLKKWDESANIFNLTWTYRWDSDIVGPYGSFRPITEEEIRNRRVIGKLKNNYAEGRTKMAVWFVSNCAAKSGRLEYVHQLQRHIQVDIYGGCGTLKCPHNKQAECRSNMERDYKFVISFENSMCLDYITEKFFYNLGFNIVPIVLDLNGNYAKIAPPKSYINVLDYPTVKDLADYLKVLDKNDTLYNEYFWWKKHYVFGGSSPACQLCSRLHDPSHPISVQKNLTKWWHYDASCKTVKFGQDNETWVAEDFNPPYDGQWPHGPGHWNAVANFK